VVYVETVEDVIVEVTVIVVLVVTNVVTVLPSVTVVRWVVYAVVVLKVDVVVYVDVDVNVPPCSMFTKVDRLFVLQEIDSKEELFKLIKWLRSIFYENPSHSLVR
jgi:hypothetical protein